MPTTDSCRRRLEPARLDDFVGLQLVNLSMPIDPANLSGGQRQRIAIACTLLHDMYLQ